MVATLAPTPDVAAALEWLERLYAGCSGWINLFSVEADTGRRRVEWASLQGLWSLRRPIGKLAAAGDVWFGVAPRVERLDGNQRGGASVCVAIPALWLDVDIAGPAHRLPNLPADWAAARALIDRFPLQPTAVVNSGYGMQVWWRLAEPVPAAQASELLVRWQVTWEKIADQRGAHLDNVANIDRVMRLPGTFNWKLGEPQPVKVRAQWKVEYQLSTVQDCLEPTPTVEQRQARLTTQHLAGSRFNEQITAKDILRAHGWVFVRQDRRTGDSHWRHPAALNETSATVYGDDGHTSIWSETVAAATGVPLRRPLDPYGLYTWLDFHGNFAASHADLIQRGFRDLGDPPARPPKLATVVQDPITSGRRLVVKAFSEITPVVPEWHWRGWLPKGKLVVLEGDPSTGKSTVSLDLAARMTVGAPMPDGTDGPGPCDVVVLSAEDDPDDTTVWRLKAAGADLTRVHHVQAIVDEEGEMSPVVLPANVNLLWAKLKEIEARLVIVDVLASFLGAEVDAHKDADVRRALQPLVDMSRATEATTMLVRHLRKDSVGKAIYAGNGSIGIAGVARAVHHIGYHPEDATIRVLAAVKVNTEAKPNSLTFRLLKHETMPCTFVEWGPEVAVSADELVSGLHPDPGPRDQCREYIRELLPFLHEGATESVRMESREMDRVLLEQGFTEATIRRAIGAERLQKKAEVDPGSEGGRIWRRFRTRPAPLGHTAQNDR
jgi:hypothetical protein